ncbi:MAG: glycogen debranching enzyme family protein [Oscillospiraceae bacterium]|nr:glycogen debranching enzyme family protein [Oscillospiraceae bacterium]
MRFYCGKQEMRSLSRAQENSFLLTNGLGGYASVTAAFSVNRCDQGILVAAVTAPNERITMVHRLQETLRLNGREVNLSTQVFADRNKAEEGCRNLSSFVYEYTPCWNYHVDGVRVERKLCMDWEKNASAVLYTVENLSEAPCTLEAVPYLKFAPKEDALRRRDRQFQYENGMIRCGGRTLYMQADASVESRPMNWQTLAYPEDEKDGRPKKGLAASCCAVTRTVSAGQTVSFEIVFSMEKECPSGAEMLAAQELRLWKLEEKAPFADPVARQLLRSADAYIARRDSTDGKTILAGYPLFSDWGRDTMIALPGCCLAAGRYDDARSILRTFLAYEKDGLVPNLFPEGGNEPMYNTVDAALLLIDCVWQYVQRTGDWDFVEEAYPVLERIIAAYRKGTHHAIGMDEDGLIHAGGGLDQVTWMDVCVNGILPTPRHGKPVEVNAYWYSALRIMEVFAGKLGRDGAAFGSLAEKVKESFMKKFYMEDKGYLKDVISGTGADEQLRCNQIWAVSMPFTMLSPEQERSVVDTVYRHLYTPCGLRTLSPKDPEYHPVYGGPQVERDMAYHQGTTWVFPMGAYYLAWLKVHGSTPEAARYVRERLNALEPMLREGCFGQLPEIYDGDFPTDGKGCFAQAWSVGEMLRVFEAIDMIEKK